MRWTSIIVLALVLTSCSDTFLDPFDNEDKYYTIFGYLDPLEEIQQLRLIPITRFPEDIIAPHEPQAVIDAKVYLRDLTIPRVERWWPVLEEAEDGSYVHTYVDTMEVKAGHTYQIEIVRSDGIMTTAKTTVPRVRTETLLLRNGPVQLSDLSVFQEIGVPNTPELWDMQVIYMVEGTGGSYSERVMVAYDHNQLSSNDGVLRYNLSLTADQEPIQFKAQQRLNSLGSANTSISLTAMGVRFRIIDDAWFPLFKKTDVLDLAQPGTFSNVENGYGFFGSMGLYEEEWEVQPELANLLGYPLTIQVN